jgi:hypothetical protein
MWILSLILIIAITYESYRFLPKYIRFRNENHLCKAVMTEFTGKTLLNSFGVLPKLNYTIDDVKYEMIIPISSSFVTVDNPVIGNEILIYYNPNDPSECVMKADFKVLVQVFVTIIVYYMSIYLLINS